MPRSSKTQKRTDMKSPEVPEREETQEPAMRPKFDVDSAAPDAKGAAAPAGNTTEETIPPHNAPVTVQHDSLPATKTTVTTQKAQGSTIGSAEVMRENAPQDL